MCGKLIRIACAPGKRKKPIIPHRTTAYLMNNFYTWKRGSQQPGRFPFSQNFLFNCLKCKWNSRIKGKIPGTNERPSEVRHFFFSNRSEWKLTVLLYKISILLSSCPSISPLRKFSLSSNAIASLEQMAKDLLTRKVSGLSNRKFWANRKRPSSIDTKQVLLSSSVFLSVTPYTWTLHRTLVWGDRNDNLKMGWPMPQRPG